jgi:hypothetical protein
MSQWPSVGSPVPAWPRKTQTAPLPPALTLGVQFRGVGGEVPNPFGGRSQAVVHNITEIPTFANYTLEELRYYDYVRRGYAVVARS